MEQKQKELVIIRKYAEQTTIKDAIKEYLRAEYRKMQREAQDD